MVMTTGAARIWRVVGILGRAEILLLWGLILLGLAVRLT
jgi:hypothetical protein